MPDYPVLENPFRVRMTPAACAADLGDGSERGEYVDQDYILRLLGRPHRSINLMYCYYPLDKGWPVRASKAFPPTANFAWAYPYDDYFPYGGGPAGSPQNEPFGQMRDIRRHGQDITLTLTMDCKTPDTDLKWIARELKPYGPLHLRINHECDGDWFAFNKRSDRKTIAAFFIKFNGILKEIAPAIRTVCCFGTIEGGDGKLKHIDDLGPMLDHADIWSMDRYLSLHYAWPFNVCERDQLGKGYVNWGVDHVWKEMFAVYAEFVRRTGKEKSLEICELNADGDVEGAEKQSELMYRFYDRVRTQAPGFLKAITCYQFRDRGRLGLEKEDPNNPAVGIPQPFLARYKELIRDPYFNPGEDWKPLGKADPLGMEWRAADDSDGLGWEVRLTGRPIFLDLLFQKEANLVVRAGAEWFYKRPGTEWVDATTAVAGFTGPGEITVAVFAPPADGTNGVSPSVRARLAFPPRVRIRYPWGQDG